MASVGCLNSVPGSYRLFKCLRAFSVRSGFHTKPILILNRLYNGASINSTRCSSIFSMTETKYISITSVGLLMRIQSSVVRSRFSTEINANKVKIEGVTEIPTTNEGDSESKKKKEADFSMKAMKYTFISFGLLFSGLTGYLIATWGAPGIDEEGKIIEDSFSKLPWWKAYAMRTWKEINYYDKMIKEPSREKLLPDPLTEPYYQPPYTLVLEMTGVLVHPDWTYKTGWRFKKRPGVDFFLQQVGPPLFEVVIYTAEQGFTAFPILDTLDPNGFIMYRLFRDATRYLKGHHVKDLSCLNRDLSKVIFIDWNDRSFQLQPDNALKLQKWTGNDEDRTLVDLAAFLRTIATSQVEDVRSVLSFYRQYDDPIEAFKVNQKRLQEEQQKLAQQRRTEQDISVIKKKWLA